MANNIKFIRGKIRFNKTNAVLTIPAALAKQLYKGEKVEDSYLTVVNGCLSVSPRIPDLVLPMGHLDDRFWAGQKV